MDAGDKETKADLLDKLGVAVFRIDREFKLKEYNRAGGNMLAERKAEGQCYTRLYGRKQACPYCVFGRDEEPQKEQTVERLIQRRDRSGEERSYRVLFTRLDEDHIIESVEDVTLQQEDQEEKLRKENLAALGTMISGISHELNNPLTGMGLNLQNLMANIDTIQTDELRSRLEMLRKDLRRASVIVSDILSFSNPARPRRTQAHIHQTIRKAIDNTKRLYPVLTRQVEWRLEGEELILSYEPEKLERVFINLFRNSVQALDYQPGEIRIEVKQAARAAHIVVEDNAGGIEPEHLRKIFQPFYSGQAQGKGTGLGLSICHGIIREHHGRIHVRSLRGGTRFYISLPLDDN